MSTPEGAAQPIPTFKIDLARPPRQRYTEVVERFGLRMRSLTSLFDDLLAMFIAASWMRSMLGTLSKLCLRRVYGDEENEEIRGIAEISGVPLYLLVALNSLLDVLLGCTSGAVPVSQSTKSKSSSSSRGDQGLAEDGQPRLMHFRTLDWGMDELRDLLVVLEFVDSSSDAPDRVIARSITYAGFVGMLTAVRKDLSISLNFRPNHDSHFSKSVRWHQLLVVLGRRKSISSIVRSTILEPLQSHTKAKESPQENPPKISEKPVSKIHAQAKTLASILSAPCYLILCDGREAAVIEKDYKTGRIRTSTDFIAQTNHDHQDEKKTSQETDEEPRADRREIITSSFEVEGWIDESVDRLECIAKRWRRHTQRAPVKNSAISANSLPVVDAEHRPSITEGTLRRWVSQYPTMNEVSHFATIMDPTAGEIRWLRRGVVEGGQE
ncbi:Uu.00g034840.m01.CDS01 [Anthostomella pinea]|uniref:ceramidase n=1 Tax=Anthostomella pinea TaxID=933095 RepID=A0AAI8V947_9PEZI|nr:Uu.00g034840.m01.CDS01 [Anthostomella pinea]